MASPSAPYWLLPFDRDADYVYGAWPRGFTVNGKHPRVGEPVDKNDFSTRMLRAYYEKRWIRRLEEADRKYLKIEDRPFGAPPEEKPNVVEFKRPVIVERKNKRGRPAKSVKV